MIRDQAIRERSTEWQMRVDVVEKDYVLGWLLAALATADGARGWIFKGGTCIKKCYFETYRFSEDLDFSLLPEARYTPEAILEALRLIASAANEMSGIEFPEALIEVRSRRNKQGQATFEGRIPYLGPLAYPGYPRVRVDITQNEPVFDAVAERGVFHPYPDELPGAVAVATYSFDELLAEKTRALFERARPRDLYDVVYLLDNRPDAFDLERVHELFEKKCQAKGLSVPSARALIEAVRADEELRSEWSNMLAHQLPALPDLDELLRRLPGLLSWIDEPAVVLAEMRLASVPIPADERRVAATGMRYWGKGLPLETIRFAGANRLLVEFEHDGIRHVIEPYALAETATGNILLYGWEQASSRIEMFDVTMIERLRIPGNSFSPRYRVDLSSLVP